MDYSSDDFLRETLYELSSCIIQRDYPIDVFRKKLEFAISKGFQINYRDDSAGVIGYPLLIRAIWGSVSYWRRNSKNTYRAWC